MSYIPFIVQVVAEITHPDFAGSESDLGLSPGGKIKLIKSSTIQLENPLRYSSLLNIHQSYNWSKFST